MRFTTVALVVGVAIGLCMGGRLAHLGRRSFRAWPLLAAGVALQLVDSSAALAASYLCLVAFALANLRFRGFGLLAVGLGLNAAVVLANGGMPVHADGVALSGKHHIEGPGDRLTFLDDRIDVPFLGEVLSFGDLVLAVGLVVAVASLAARPPEGRHAQLADDSGAPRLR
ncbi:MAG TPA: DUF5317 family protein [Acidimicrobiales bacterium]|jgi:hypothetical protein|nr:DUF5317 family protein [Acidimicrobiales bacterium]